MMLELGKRRALEQLAINPGVEVKCARKSLAAHVWLGLGYAVAKGWVTYRGDTHFAITAEGMKALAEMREEQLT